MSFRETEFISWVYAAAGRPARLAVGPGDDAAVFPDGLVVAVDAVVEGVHFLAEAGPALITHKALARPLSDLCAMGAQGESVFIAALLPPDCDGRALAAGLGAAAQRLGVAIAGGDTKRAPRGALAFAVTALGRCAAARPWTRRGAQARDLLAVSGALGGSLAGRHLSFLPRRDVVAALVAGGTAVHACIDLSDGLGRNLRQLCEASGCGARVRAEDVPIHADVPAGTARLEAALGDGEDYELLLSLAPGQSLPLGLQVIGEVTAERHIELIRGGHSEPWPAGGFEHVF
ncbi:MAG: thiamine-phosphate kinase [Planctomycetota bacterium]